MGKLRACKGVRGYIDAAFGELKMANAKAPNGDEKSIRVIVFRENEMYIAQCIDYDIATQAKNIDELIDRLELTVEAEFAYCEELGQEPHKVIVPAPNYYHELWEKRHVSIQLIQLPKPDGSPLFEMALAKAA